MSILPLVLYPDPRLQQPCASVTAFDARLHTLLDNMRATMFAEQGIGLAAPQIGVMQQIAVVDVSEEGDSPIEIINPVIKEKSGSVSSEEGCLSIPGFRESISRAERVVVQFQDRNGSSQELSAEGLLAICLQHEIDHLNGVLFVDHLSRLKRDFFRRWFNKQGGQLSAKGPSEP